MIVNFRNHFDKALTKKVCNAGPYTVQKSHYFEYAVQKSVARFWGWGDCKSLS